MNSPAQVDPPDQKATLNGASKDVPVNRVTHYADEDHDLQPLCRGGAPGDMMTFFWHETTCGQCEATAAALSEFDSP